MDRRQGMAVYQRIIENRASVFAQLQLGRTGNGRLELPLRRFSASISMVFTARERSLARQNGALMVVTYDPRDRPYNINVLRFARDFELRQGWEELTAHNHFDEDTVVTLWYYRERRVTSPNYRQLNFIITRDAAVSPGSACLHCGRIFCCQ